MMLRSTAKFKSSAGTYTLEPLKQELTRILSFRVIEFDIWNNIICLFRKF